MVSSKAKGPGARTAVHLRTQELALRAGREPPYVAQTDYEQAKREVTGETEVERQNAALDSSSVAPWSARERSAPR